MIQKIIHQTNARLAGLSKPRLRTVLDDEPNQTSSRLFFKKVVFSVERESADVIEWI